MPAPKTQPLPPPPAKQPPPKPEPPPKPSLEHYTELGDPVLWYAGGSESSPPWPGFVTLHGMDSSVNLNVLHPNYANMHLKDGVLHMDHPKAGAGWNKSGGWRHRPVTVALRRMLLTLGLLAWRLKKNNEWELVSTTEDELSRSVLARILSDANAAACDRPTDTSPPAGQI